MFVTDAIYPLIRAEKEMLGKIQKDDGGFDISWNGRADVRNIASNKVLEKCGFIKEGTIRQGKMVSVYCDYHIYGMLREDYAKID